MPLALGRPDEAIGQPPGQNRPVTTDIAKHGVNVNFYGRNRRFQTRQSLLVQTSAVLLGAVLERLVNNGRNVFERYGDHADTISQPFRLSM
jgi:hypothetical protein